MISVHFTFINKIFVCVVFFWLYSHFYGHYLVKLVFFLWFFKSQLFQKLQQKKMSTQYFESKNKNTVNKMIKQECLC